MSTFRFYLFTILPVVVMSTLAVVNVLMAFTEPASAPPGGNVYAPLNAGPAGQAKTGGLIVGTNCTGECRVGLIVDKGNVGIGTTGPGFKLHVDGGWLRVQGTGQGGDAATRIGIYDTNNSGSITGWWLSQNQDGTFAIHQNGAGDRLTINGSGHVGASGNIDNRGSVMYSNRYYDDDINFWIDANTESRMAQIRSTGLEADGRAKIGNEGDYADVYETELLVQQGNIHVIGNENLVGQPAGVRSRLRLGNAWGYAGVYAETATNGAGHDLVLGASSGRVRIGPESGPQQLCFGGNCKSDWPGDADHHDLHSIDGVANAGGDIDLVAGANVTITPDDANNKITISSTDTNSGGDITAVTAGTGLSGGGASGDVTLSLNTADISACTAAGKKIIWNSTNNRLACADDQTGSLSEIDPKVGSPADKRVPRWDGAGGKLIDSTIFDNGNVGIGTTEPIGLLHINSTRDERINIRVQPTIKVETGFPSNAAVVRIAAPGGFGELGFGGSSYDFWGGAKSFNIVNASNGFAPAGPITFGHWWRPEEDREDMRITVSGNVGIGTRGPGAKLHVSGCSNPNCARKPGGGSWDTESDARLKDVLNPFGRGLDAILGISPVYYRYKDMPELGLSSAVENVGVVAQEVQKLIPEAVSLDKNGYLTLNNDPIFWTMLNAIKEQQEQINELRQEVEKLKTR